MKAIRFTEANGGVEAWWNAKLGKITGSRLKNVITLSGSTIKPDAWRLVAERLIGSAAIAEDFESKERAMQRGTRLEKEALARFSKETGKKVETEYGTFIKGELDATVTGKIFWMRDDDESIAVSPDGAIGKTAAVEVKCLNAGSHIEAKVTGVIPNDGYREQALQEFIVNEKLGTLYFVFYDPRFLEPGLDFFYITIKRQEVSQYLKADIEEYLEYQKLTLAWVRDTVVKLTT